MKFVITKAVSNKEMICTNGESERTVISFKFLLSLFELEKACEVLIRNMKVKKCEYSYEMNSR